MLHGITNAINFIALMMALWLGLYLVTRSPHRPETWLSALALWSMGAYFLNQLLALNPPPTPPTEIREWLYRLMLFWPRDVFELGWKGWLQGWLPSYGIVFWYHATQYMLPGRFSRARLVKASIGYTVVFAGILIKVRYRSAWTNLAGDPLYNSSLSYPLFPLFALGFMIIAALSVSNLVQTARASPAFLRRGQLRLFASATLLGGATGLLGIASTLLKTPVPQALPALFLSAALLLTGIGVARYNALLDRRPMQRDFLYSAIEAGAVLLIYMVFHRLFTGLYPMPAISFVFVGCLAVVSHLLIDVARLRLDRLFLHNLNQRLRLRQLYNLIGDREGREVLEMALERIASGVDATWALLLQLSPNMVRPLAAWNWVGALPKQTMASFGIGNFHVDELVVLSPQQLPPPLDQATLMVPLFEQEQTGVLIFGPSHSQAGYSEAELGSLQDAGDLLAGLIRKVYPAGEHLARLEGAPLPATAELAIETEEISPRWIEMGLRNLHNYAYLADSPLTQLRLIRQCTDSLERGTYTHIDQGKALSEILVEAVRRLRPAQEQPAGPPSRKCYPYIILRDAYLEDEPNREIMSRLYISEGTFNRTRRAAIWSVARILKEMEAGLE